MREDRTNPAIAIPLRKMMSAAIRSLGRAVAKKRSTSTAGGSLSRKYIEGECLLVGLEGARPEDALSRFSVARRTLRTQNRNFDEYRLQPDLRLRASLKLYNISHFKTIYACRL